MYTRAVLIASSILLAYGTPSAIAADIYAPSSGGLKDPAIQQEVLLPEAVVFQEYAEWYIRGDVGVGRFADMDGYGSAVTGGNFAVGGLDFDNTLSAGIGFGRYLTPNIRIGIDFDYRQPTSSQATNGNFTATNWSAIPQLTNLDTIPIELTTKSIMLNAVYDFTPHRRWSPYVGGGIGWAFHSMDFNGSTYTNDVDPFDTASETGTVNSSGGNSNSFAANLMAGVSVSIRQGLFVDVGYKFSYLGDADMDFNVSHTGAGGYSSKAAIGFDDITTHEFKIGLRYDLY